MSDATIIDTPAESASEQTGDTAKLTDLLDRTRTIEKLTNLVATLKGGKTIAIDAGWGEGKTHFAKLWRNHLEKTDQGYRVLWLDAFGSDYEDDPFLAIAKPIITAAKEAALDEVETARKFGRVARKLAPAILKAGWAFGTKWTIGEVAGQELTTAIQDAGKDAIDLLAKDLAAQADSAAEQTALTNELELLAQKSKSKTGGPLVYFIDELDRCKPDYAIRLLERIKHFFNVPGIVFVLMINQRQLAASIAKTYGLLDGGEEYLSKFFDIPYRLDRPNKNRSTGINCYEEFITEKVARMELNRDDNNQWLYAFRRLALSLELNARQIEHCLDLFAIYAAQPKNNAEKEMQDIAAWLMVLKVTNYNMFVGIKTNDPALIAESAILLQQKLPADSRVKAELQKFYSVPHSESKSSFDWALLCLQSHISSENPLPDIAKMIEF